MTINICLCGTEAGYPHDEYCPFPYFGSVEKMIDRWEHLRKLEIDKARWYEKLLAQEEAYPLPELEPCGHGVND